MSEDTEKEHAPSAKRLEDARRKGDIPRSPEVNSAAALAGLAALLMVAASGGLSDWADAMLALLAHADQLAPDMLPRLILDGIAPLGLILLLPAAPVIAAIVAQRIFAIVPDRIAPKFSRIDPVQNLGQKFGRQNLVEFAKGLVKITLIGIVVWKILAAALPSILTVDPDAGIRFLPQAAAMVRTLVHRCLLIGVTLGILDFLWQHFEHRRRNMMSRQDLIDEMKESEGDAHTKQQRKQKGISIVMNKMLKDVETADVVIVNPTHYAVALKWDRRGKRAPVCVAKGVDEVALTIRRVAQTNGVPVRSDPPVARALFATVKLGGEVRPDNYRAVAAAIRFADSMRRKARAA